MMKAGGARMTVFTLTEKRRALKPTETRIPVQHASLAAAKCNFHYLFSRNEPVNNVADVFVSGECKERIKLNHITQLPRRYETPTHRCTSNPGESGDC